MQNKINSEKVHGPHSVCGLQACSWTTPNEFHGISESSHHGCWQKNIVTVAAENYDRSQRKS